MLPGYSKSTLPPFRGYWRGLTPDSGQSSTPNNSQSDSAAWVRARLGPRNRQIGKWPHGSHSAGNMSVRAILIRYADLPETAKPGFPSHLSGQCEPISRVEPAGALKGAPRIMTHHSAFRKSLGARRSNSCSAPRPPLAPRSQVLTFSCFSPRKSPFLRVGVPLGPVKPSPRIIAQPQSFAVHIRSIWKRKTSPAEPLSSKIGRKRVTAPPPFFQTLPLQTNQ